MDNRKDDYYFAIKAIENINTIEEYIVDVSYDDFLCNHRLQDAIMFRLVQLIENVKNISDDFKFKHPNIPWGKIIGFRNGIVHEYGKTDYLVVYETITMNLDELKETLRFAKKIN